MYGRVSTDIVLYSQLPRSKFPPSRYGGNLQGTMFFPAASCGINAEIRRKTTKHGNSIPDWKVIVPEPPFSHISNHRNYTGPTPYSAGQTKRKPRSMISVSGNKRISPKLTGKTRETHRIPQKNFGNR